MCDIIEVTDLDAPELDVYARLTQAQLRSRREPEKGIFIAESPKVIERALNAGYAPISFLAEKRLVAADAGETRQLLEKYPDVPVFTAEYNVLTKLTGFALTRGMLCAMKRNVLPSVEDVCKPNQCRSHYPFCCCPWHGRRTSHPWLR